MQQVHIRTIDFNLPSARVRAVSIRNIALFYLLSALFPCLLPSLLGQLPMRAVKAEQSALQFEPNLGQDKSSARYISCGDGNVLRLGPASATMALHHAPIESAAASTDNRLSNAIELKFVGGDLDSSIVGESEAISRHSYFPSGDPKSWSGESRLMSEYVTATFTRELIWNSMATISGSSMTYF